MRVGAEAAPTAVPAVAPPDVAGRDALPRGATLDRRRASFAVFALAALTLLAGVGLRDPWPADEPRFAQVAREMVESGRWLFPTRGGELYSDKPPVFMWTIAALYRLTGDLRIAFLLPSALSALLTLLLVHDLARRWWGRGVANRAALLLLATLQFVLQAKSAQIDAMVTLWITLGSWGLLRHLVVALGTDDLPTGAGTLRWWFLGWFAMGVGIITKGVGFLPALLAVPWLGLVVTASRDGAFRGGVPCVRRPAWPMALGPLALVGAVALWLAPMWLAVERSGDPALLAYRDDILLRQTAERYTDSWAHVEPWHYFLVSVVPALWLPASALLPWLARHWRGAFAARDPRVVLPLVWIVLVVAFFSASPGKRGVYVLPAVPMLALAAAPYLDAVLLRAGPARLIRALLALAGLALFGLGVAGTLGIEAALRLERDEGIAPWTLALALGAVALAAAWACRRGRVGLAWLGFVVPTWLLYSTWGYAIANPGRTPEATFDAVEAAVAETGSAPTRVELALVDFREQYLLFSPYPPVHFGYATDDAAQVAEAWRWLGEKSAGTTDAPPRRYVLMADRHASSCLDRTRAVRLPRSHGRDWRLYGPETRAATCTPPSVPVPRFEWRLRRRVVGAGSARR